MSKTQAKANPTIQAAAELALVKFPAPKFKAALGVIGAEHDSEATAKDKRTEAAFTIVTLADEYREANPEATAETLAKGWSAEVAKALPALSKAGNRYVEVTEAKGDKAASFRLTGYGNNVVSTARGVLEFDVALDAAPAVTDDGKLDTDKAEALTKYRPTERVVKAHRAAKRAETNPDAELERMARVDADAAWKRLRELVFNTGDVQVIGDLADMLSEQADSVEAQLAQAAEIEAEAEAA